jgi:hypoxanthine phosphoribosyltransferase
MISNATIHQRITKLASLIHHDYQNQRPVLICTLKGACVFFQHLCDALQYHQQGYDIEFVRASSYEGTATTGKVEIMSELKMDAIRSRHVILIEDIVDTGTTLATVIPFLQQHGQPSSIEVCTLLDKRHTTPKKQFAAKYIGFSIPNLFIVGYGLDYNELYRDVRV